MRHTHPMFEPTPRTIRTQARSNRRTWLLAALLPWVVMLLLALSGCGSHSPTSPSVPKHETIVDHWNAALSAHCAYSLTATPLVEEVISMLEHARWHGDCALVMATSMAQDRGSELGSAGEALARLDSLAFKRWPQTEQCFATQPWHHIAASRLRSLGCEGA